MQLKHIFLAILVAVLWGFNFVASKYALKEVPQFLFAGTRFLLLTLPFIFFVPKPNISWTHLISIGFIQGFMAYACLFKGLTLGCPAGITSVAFQIHIAFTLVLSYFVLKITPTRRQVFGVCVSAVGMFMIIKSLHAQSIPIEAMLMVLAASMCWAISNLLLKCAGNVNSFSLVIWTCIFAPIPNYICAYFLNGPDVIAHTLENISFYAIVALFYVVVFVSLIGSTTQTYLIRTYSPNIVMPYSLLIPIVGMGAGWIVFGETMSLETIIACAVVFIGLAINQSLTYKKINPLFKNEKL
ncbi:MAG: EamA family transporter [Candidatus Paracaedibacteraceae bacterium]|nr:EamA family transporter [Candidatus Paracaedibacteraceae bacterium]